MRTKKTLALLMAALMLVMLVPISAISEPADAPVDPFEGQPAAAVKGDEKAHESYFNANYTYLNYTDSGTHNWANKYDSSGEYYYIESGNAGVAGSTSIISTGSIYMYGNEKVTFQYWYSTEENYDWFSFKVNGENVLTESGESNGWKSYTWRASSNGYYELEWRYYKDSSQNAGSDCVRLAYCRYNRHELNWADEAAFSAGGGGMSGSLNFTSYGFEPVRAGNSSSAHPFYIRSDNIGVDGSSAYYYTNCYVPEGAENPRLVFDYALSCEHPYDHFVLLENNTAVFDSKDLDTDPDYTWTRYYYDIPGPGNYTYAFQYIKDSTDSYGSDCLCLDNIHIEGCDTAEARFLGLSGLNASGSDATLYFNTPAGSEGFSANSSNTMAKPKNRYIDSSTAYMETYVTMAQGETLSFQYNISSEKSFDFFRFYANGEMQLEDSGWTDRTAKTYTFTAPQSRTYLFRWEYAKDSSNSRGRDELCIHDVKYTGSYHNDRAANLDTILNHADTEVELHYIGGVGVGGWFEPYVTPYWQGLISRNKYYENTTSAIASQGVYLNATDKISFEYEVNCEDNNYDSFGFIVYRDGEEVYHFSDCGENNTWWVHTYVCDQGGLYSFAWVYAKDEEGDYYDDCVIIDNVKIDRNEDALYYACNPDSDDPDDLVFSFMTGGEYPFVTEGDGDGRYYARSTNMGVDSSVSRLEATAYLAAPGAQIAFDFNISSEPDYDVLRFYVNDTLVWSASGYSNPGWHSVTIPNTYSGMVDLRWEYVKDTSVSRGDDRACIDNVRVIPQSTVLMGDADGNGTVNANDALMILRYALGIISSLPHPENCDVDGNGSINANDALMVLRYSLGIIPGL